jgi:hypothetical protein
MFAGKPPARVDSSAYTSREADVFAEETLEFFRDIGVHKGTCYFCLGAWVMRLDLRFEKKERNFCWMKLFFLNLNAFAQ